MRYLYIDTSSSYLYTAIVENEKLLGEIKEEFGQSLSEVALPKIASLFTNNNIEAKDIDKIIVVDDGRIAEQGTHSELIAQGGIYAKLIDMQSLK